MLIYRLLLVGILSRGLSLSQVLEESTEQRHSRSVVNMDELLKVEDDLAGNLEKYKEQLSHRAETIRWGIHQMKEMLRKRKSFWNNPFITYSLIRHMQADWLMWQEYLKKPVGLEQLIFMQSRNLSMPREHDFMDAADGVTRMQGTYQLLASDIANGLLDRVQYNSSLAAIDCLELGRDMIQQNYLPSAEQWILAGIEAYDRPVPQMEMQLLRGPKKADLYNILGQVRAELENYVGAFQAYQMALKESPHDLKIYQEYQAFEKGLLTSPEKRPDTFKQDEEDEAYVREQLPNCCSGRCEVPQKLRKLYCLYNRVTSPFLRLAPIKTEILSIEPFVVILHDMVSKKEGALIRSSSKKHLLPSAIASVDAPKEEYQVASSRTSKSVSFPNDFNNATLKISERLEEATGLDMFHTEYFQITNYGLGGFFETHIDTLLSNETRFNGTRDRIATALFYLNDVPQGGGTHFPKLNLTVFPKAGSVLFWYNLDFKGNDVMNTLHTGCPVIVGSKWVISKWISDMGQELKRPCIESISNVKYLNSAKKLLI
ncbi:prolyl 4-hydroxylase subunit alpha-1-like [Drosophila suzukii]|uniref:procollagen-proline 4-dioxygenase n=1 Tax=Drosophila suzukii TaxID=28584 RepID=A0ABM4TRU5_DROSZ